MINVIQGEGWRSSIIAYLHHYYKPDSNAELLRIQKRATTSQQLHANKQ
jgi:hypothetical protein